MENSAKKSNFQRITEQLEQFINAKDNFKIPIHVIPVNFNRQSLKYIINQDCFNEIIKELQKKYGEAQCIEFPSNYEFNEQHYSKVVKAKILLRLSENMLALIYEDAACVILINDSDYYNGLDGDDRKFIEYKGSRHNDIITNNNKQCFSMNITILIELIKKCIKKHYGKKRFIQYDDKIPYIFSMLFSHSLIDENIKAAILDPRLVIFDTSEYKNQAEIDNRIAKIDVSKLQYMQKIDVRQEYNAYFSWAAGVVDNISSLSVIIEYCLLEAQMQNRWNCLYQFSKTLDANLIKKSNHDKIIEELTNFECELNSLADASDSERLRLVRGKLVESSNIDDMLVRIKNVVQSRKSKFSISVSFAALVVAICAAAVSLTALILQIIFQAC